MNARNKRIAGGAAGRGAVNTCETRGIAICGETGKKKETERGGKKFAINSRHKNRPEQVPPWGSGQCP